MYQSACAHDASVYIKIDKGWQVDGGEANIETVSFILIFAGLLCWKDN